MSDAIVEKVARDIVGTAGNIHDLLEEEGLDFDKLTTEQYHLIDSIAWECVRCNWWVEPSEVNEDDICEDCRDGEDEEDT